MMIHNYIECPISLNIGNTAQSRQAVLPLICLYLLTVRYRIAYTVQR